MTLMSRETNLSVVSLNTPNNDQVESTLNPIIILTESDKSFDCDVCTTMGMLNK